jgi:hypothetical protein
MLVGGWLVFSDATRQLKYFYSLHHSIPAAVMAWPPGHAGASAEGGMLSVPMRGAHSSMTHPLLKVLLALVLQKAVSGPFCRCFWSRRAGTPRSCMCRVSPLACQSGCSWVCFVRCQVPAVTPPPPFHLSPRAAHCLSWSNGRAASPEQTPPTFCKYTEAARIQGHRRRPPRKVCFSRALSAMMATSQASAAPCVPREFLLSRRAGA